LGVVTDGSLTKGLTARLNGGKSVEEVRVGRFVKIQGNDWDFFCLVTDVILNAVNAQVLDEPPPPEDAFLREVLAGTATYGSILLQPMLMLAKDPLDGYGAIENGHAAGNGASGDGALFGRPMPVRTVPVHFAPVDVADEADFDRVFTPKGDKSWEVGTPLDMDIPVRLDLERLAERSNGVFGKSGSGKSMLTRVLLCGMIRARQAVSLIFDMHSEYAWPKRDEASGTQLKALKELFASEVAVYRLHSGRERPAKLRDDGVIRIGLNEIEIEDFALLADLLKLNETAVEEIHLLQGRYGDRWASELLDMDGPEVKEFADSAGGHAGALSALRRKVLYLADLEFVTREYVPKASSSIEHIIRSLASGQNVVLAFEHASDLLSYMLVANVITRRIYDRWRTDTDAYHAQEGPKPHHLIITVEEAHRFLSPAAARYTTFGTIAREMRKYNATLLIVDQRPSAIDAEVLSQIGTRLTCQLNDENDISAILAGVSGAGHLRSVLAALDSQQQAMLLGHAVPMPISVKVRTIDERFYEDVTAGRRGPVFPGGQRPSQLISLRDDLA
jgi:DNA helicase HerA-like ATPase